MKRLHILLASIAVPLFAQTPTPPAPAPEKPRTGKTTPTGTITDTTPRPTTPPVANDPFVKDPNAVPQKTELGLETQLEVQVLPQNFQLLFESYDVSRADFASLVLDAGGDDAAFYARVNEWTAAKRAKLVQFFAATGRGGVRGVIESIDEVRYAIEFEQPIAEEDMAYPTTFETRNAGQTFEFEYTPSDQSPQHWSLAVAVNSVRFARFDDCLGAPDRPTSVIPQPIFSARKFSTNLALPLGSVRFAGTQSASKDDTTPGDTVRLLFIRSRAVQHQGAPLPAGTGKTYRLEYTFFSLDRIAARDLLLREADPQKCHDALRELVQAGKARLEHVSSSVTHEGDRTVTEEIVEQRYGIEFNSPHFPSAGEPRIDNSSDPEPVEPKTTPDGKPVPPKPAPTSTTRQHASQHVIVSNPLPPSAFPKKAPLPPMPTTFETRNTGFTAECEFSPAADQSSLEVQCVPQFVRYLGDSPRSATLKSYPAQPLFEGRKTNVSMYAVPGQQEFLSTYNVPIDTGIGNTPDDGRVTLGFLRVVPVK